jgi:hypothetical protein
MGAANGKLRFALAPAPSDRDVERLLVSVRRRIMRLRRMLVPRLSLQRSGL